MKKLNNKGFTLVEIVIVIVIIAILAAMLVPSLTAWIDKSKVKTFTSACGTIKTAVWSEVAEKYAIDGTTTVDSWDKITDAVGKTVSGTAIPDGGYKVTYDYSAGSMTVEDKTYTGTWASSSATSWTVEKKGASK